MKIEICDNTFYTALTVAIAAIILGSIALMSSGYTDRAKAAFSAGYEESQSYGSEATRWTKAKTNE